MNSVYCPGRLQMAEKVTVRRLSPLLSTLELHRQKHQSKFKSIAIRYNVLESNSKASAQLSESYPGN